MNKLIKYVTIVLILFIPIMLIDDIVVLDSIRGISNVNLFKFQRIYKYLSKYTYALDKTLLKNLEPNGKYENCIWVLWLQGEENAPGIVKNCIKSIRKHSNGRRVLVLDNGSIGKYIELPQFIIDKYNDGSIKPVFFSDIVRCCLLHKYGGTWIDATVLLTDKLPDMILKTDFFMFQTARRYIVFRRFCPATYWFIHTKPGNPIMKDLINLLFEYWRHEKAGITYLFSYYFLGLAIECDPEAKRIFDKMPYIPEQWHFPIYIRHPYSKKLFDRLKAHSHFSSIHKTTHKVSGAPQGSMFEYLNKTDGYHEE